MKKILDKINSLQVLLGGLLLVVMIFLTCANILFREFGLPVRGTYEIMGLLGAVIFAFSLAYAHDMKEHLYVSIIFDRFPLKVRKILSHVNKFVCMLFFGFLSFQLVKKALILRAAGELSETLRMSYYPFIFAVAFGVLVLAVLLAYEFVSIFGENK